MAGTSEDQPFYPVEIIKTDDDDDACGGQFSRSLPCQDTRVAQ